MVAMSYFCRQNESQISLEIVVNCSDPSEILALLTINNRRTRIKNRKKQCFLLPFIVSVATNGNQKLIFNDFWSTILDSIGVFDCRLPGVKVCFFVQNITLALINLDTIVS